MKVAKQRFNPMCDMGSIKIFTDSMACFFMNDIGDGTNTVDIYEWNVLDKANKHKFLGHFTVKTKAYLSDYDCEDTPIYRFGKGRWFVYLKGVDHFIIAKCDDETES